MAPFINFSNFLFLVIIVSYLLNYFFKKKFFKKLLVSFLSIFIFISIFPIGIAGLKYLENDFIKQEKFNKYDNIVVLAGAERALATQYSKKLNLSSSSERLISAVKLALVNENSKIVYLGGNPMLSKNKLNEANIAKIFFKDIGFDIKRVIFVSNSRNTIENLKEFKNLNLSKDNNILITSASHMKRSLFLAEKLYLNFLPYAVDFNSLSARDDLINKYQMYSISANLGNFDIFFREILGIFVTSLIL